MTLRGIASGRAPIATFAGLLRSVLIYRALPWRRRALRRFYGELIEPGALTFDIGAHAGNRTATLLSLGARCVCLEPQPAFAGLLQRLYGNHRDVTLVVAAVGRTTGTATLNISTRHPTVSTLSRTWIDQVSRSDGFRQVRWDQQIEVPVTTLDRLIDEHGMPAFCKIDVEGMEAEILHGLHRAIPLLAVEYLSAAMPIATACVHRLGELGDYVFNYTTGEHHALVLHDWVDGASLLAILADTTSGSGAESGDLYARLQRTGAQAP